MDLGGTSLAVGDPEAEARGTVPEQLVECRDVAGHQRGLVPFERGTDICHDRRPVDRYLVDALRYRGRHRRYWGHRVGSAATCGGVACLGISTAAGTDSSGIGAGAGVLLRENAMQTTAASR